MHEGHALGLGSLLSWHMMGDIECHGHYHRGITASAHRAVSFPRCSVYTSDLYRVDSSQPRLYHRERCSRDSPCMPRPAQVPSRGCATGAPCSGSTCACTVSRCSHGGWLACSPSLRFRGPQYDLKLDTNEIK